MKRAWEVLAVLVLGYVLFATTYYRYSHPKKTDTELLLDIGKALTWDWE